MELLSTVLDFVQTPAFGGIMGALWMLSEALASIPSIQANSVFQAIRNGLQRFKKDPA